MTSATSTSTSTIVRTEHAAAVRPTHRPGFTDLTRGEWTKLRTLRSTWWSLGLMGLLGIAFTIIACAVYTSRFPHLDAATRLRFRQDTIGLILQPSANFACLAASVLGVLVIASEYSTGMIQATMLATPRRTSALLAKAAAFSGVVFVLSTLVALMCFFLGSAITSSHASTSIADSTNIRAILAYGLFMTSMGVLALSIGALVRHTAAAISLVLALQFVLPGVLSLIPGNLGERLSNALPSGANVMLTSGNDATNVYTPLQSLFILLGWVLVLGGAALASIKKRDV